MTIHKRRGSGTWYYYVFFAILIVVIVPMLIWAAANGYVELGVLGLLP